MDFPEVRKCCGIFPPKHATYLISIFGVFSGGVGIAGIILYGVAENLILAHFGAALNSVDEDIRKLALLTIGLTSLTLIVANVILFLGVISKSGGALTSGVNIIFGLCCLLIIGAIALPVSCFFIPSSCLVKKVSSLVVMLFILCLTIFLDIWLYFMTVAGNHRQELS